MAGYKTSKLFNGFYKVCGFQQTVAGAGVQPGKAQAQQLYAQVTAFQIGLIDAGDFQLPSGRGFHLLGDLDDFVVVEVQAGHGGARFGLGGLFFDADGALLRVKLRYAKALGVFDLVAKHRGSARVGGGFAQHGVKPWP